MARRKNIPKVSVIIATYNYANFLLEAVESLFAQTLEDFEAIVIDDGSTDNTSIVLAAIDDPRLTVVRMPHQGVCAARNEGLARARGEFIAFLDADDRWRPRKLERQVRMMEAEPDLVAVMTNFVRFDEKGFYPLDQFTFFPELANISMATTADGEGRRILGDSFSTVLSFNEIPGWSGVMLFRASAIRQIKFALRGLYKGMCSDLHFCLRAFRFGSVGFVQAPLAEVRRHGENITARASDMPRAKLAALELIFEEDLSQAQRTALRRRVGRALIEVGLQNMAEKHFRAAGIALLRALRFRGARLSALKNLAMLAVPIRPSQDAPNA